VNTEINKRYAGFMTLKLLGCSVTTQW